MSYNRRSFDVPGIYRPEDTVDWRGGWMHVNGMGLDDLHTFPDPIDKSEFLFRLERVLSPRRIVDDIRRPFPKLHDYADLYAYCVLDNHYHLLFKQKLPGGVKKIMRSVATSYGSYFNKRFKRDGQIFQSPYTTSHISNEEKLREKLVYIHLNHEVQFEQYQYCSHEYFMRRRRCDWLASEKALEYFGNSPDNYERYLQLNGPRILAQKEADRRLRDPRPRLKRGPGSHLPR